MSYEVTTEISKDSLESFSDFDFKKSPADHFDFQLKKAQDFGVRDPHAMTLSTVDKQNTPQARIVLFKGWIRNGLSFFTNYESPKAEDLAQNNKATLLFFWAQLEQQIKISGYVEKLSREESEGYFSQRPRLNQLGAWASHQSRPIPNLDYFLTQVKKYEEQFKNQQVPCPPNWGGFRLTPEYYEFWFAKQGRLHERYVYEKEKNISPSTVTSQKEEKWKTAILSP